MEKLGGVLASLITNSTIYQDAFTRSMQMRHEENLLSRGSRFFLLVYSGLLWIQMHQKEVSRNARNQQTVEIYVLNSCCFYPKKPFSSHIFTQKKSGICYQESYPYLQTNFKTNNSTLKKPQRKNKVQFSVSTSRIAQCSYAKAEHKNAETSSNSSTPARRAGTLQY